jgi:subfamily B ATP-binding cassette protein MsbA
MHGCSSNCIRFYLIMPQKSFLEIYKRIFTEYLINRYKPFCLALIAMIVVALCDPAFASLMKPLIDKNFNSVNLGSISWTPLLIALIFFIKGVAAFINEKNTTVISASIVEEMRNQLFNKIMHLSLSYYNEGTSGRIISRIIFDVTQITDAGFNIVTVSVRDGFTVIGLISVLFYTDWQLTLFCVFTMPFVLLLIRKLSKKIRMLTLNNQEQYGDMTQVLKESVDGQKLIKLSLSYEYESKKFNHLTQIIKNNSVAQVATSSLNSGLSQFLVALALSFILFFATTRSHYNGFTAGGLVSFVSAMLLIFQPMKRITAATQSVQKGFAAATSVFAVLDEVQEPNYGNLLAKNFTTEIKLVNLSFGYNDLPVLQNINISIPKGKTIALVGESGSGKSTIVNLLARFYQVPQQSILIDDIDINNFELNSWRKNICIVSQDIFLFNDTIFNNIIYGAKDKYSFADVKNATIAANAFDFIDQMPQQFDTIIGENGAKLSGGQKQRIAIARAILQNPQILILDEATSALDSATEQTVNNALEHLMKDRTTIIIAHRIYLTKNADYIYVLQNGKIIEQGNHEELIALRQNYYKLYSIC